MRECFVQVNGKCIRVNDIGVRGSGTAGDIYVRMVMYCVAELCIGGTQEGSSMWYGG